MSTLCLQLHLNIDGDLTSAQETHRDLMMQLEIYDVVFFIRSLKGPTDAFNIYDHVTIHILALHILLLTSSRNMFCQELTLQDIFTSTELLDWGTLHLPLSHSLRPATVRSQLTYCIHRFGVPTF